MFTLLAYVIVGFLGGTIAKTLLREQRSGWISTAFLGATGALLAGWLGQLLFDTSYRGIFSLTGLAFSVLGAVLILVIQGWLAKRKS